MLHSTCRRAAGYLLPPARHILKRSHVPYNCFGNGRLCITHGLASRYSTYSTTRQPSPVLLTRSDAQKQTIYALSTPPGKGGVAVIRVSGPEALEVWHRMVRPHKPKTRPAPWKLERCRVVHPENLDEVIDDGLSVFFEGL
jgi:tRNA modification GTPase